MARAPRAGNINAAPKVAKATPKHAGPGQASGLTNRTTRTSISRNAAGQTTTSRTQQNAVIPARQTTTSSGPGGTSRTVVGPNPGLAIGARLVKGVGHAGKGAASNGGGITAIMAATFAVVAIAKVRGTANISTSHALFGGFILLFILTLMYKFAPGVAMGFAVLVLITALLDYGIDAFNGLFGAGSGIPGAVQTGSGVANESTGTVTAPSAVPDPGLNAAAYMKMYPGSSVTPTGTVIPPAL